MSSVHTSEIEQACELALIHGVETAKAIGRRLAATRQALGLKPAELCRQIDCKPNRWSQYENGDRPITLEVANKLCDTYGVTLDWIYRGNRAGLPQQLHQKIKIAA